MPVAVGESLIEEGSEVAQFVDAAVEVRDGAFDRCDGAFATQQGRAFVDHARQHRTDLTVPAGEQVAALSSLLDYAANGSIQVPHEVRAADELAAAWRCQAGSPHRKILIQLS